MAGLLLLCPRLLEQVPRLQGKLGAGRPVATALEGQVWARGGLQGRLSTTNNRLYV